MSEFKAPARPPAPARLKNSGAPARQRRRGRPRRQPAAFRWLPALAAAAAIAAIAIVISRQLLAPVERVLVTGDYRAADRPALVARIEESMNGGFLWLNLDAVRAAVEAMPTVARAVVRRRWPASIEVQLRGHAIAAYWAGSGESEAEGGESGLLNQSGEQVPPQLIEGAAGMQELPRLAGPHGTEAAVLAWHRMIQNAARPLGLQARGLSMNGRGSLRARLRSGQGGPSERNEWELALGRGGIPAKLRRFQALYREQLAARAGELRRVDLRYRHGAAVAWRGDRASSHAGAPSGNPNQPPLFRAAGGI